MSWVATRIEWHSNFCLGCHVSTAGGAHLNLASEGSVMSSRFRYEPKTALQKVAMRLKHPRKWRAKITSCVFDSESGHRFQLACDEEDVIRKLHVRLPGSKEWPASLATLDDVANAIMLRRLGYVFDWTRISRVDDPGTRRRQARN
jgi:hypothetical protein